MGGRRRAPDRRRGARRRRPTSGAGYDCLGLALDLVNHVAVEGVDGDGSIELDGRRRGRGRAAVDPVEPVRRRPRGGARGGHRAAARRASAGGSTMDNAIPLSRGLGSSAAATVGGVVAGAALATLAGATCPDDDALLQIAVDHRVAPGQRRRRAAGRVRRLGAARRSRRRRPVRRPGRPALRAVHPRPAAGDRGHAARAARARCRCATPSRTWGASPSASRGSRRGRLELLADLTIDRLHEPYRSAAYPELPRLTLAAREAGALGVVPVGRRVDDPRVRRAGRATDPIEAAFRDEAAACGLAGRIAVVEPRNHGAGVVA